MFLKGGVIVRDRRWRFPRQFTLKNASRVSAQWGDKGQTQIEYEEKKAQSGLMWQQQRPAWPRGWRRSQFKPGKQVENWKGKRSARTADSHTLPPRWACHFCQKLYYAHIGALYKKKKGEGYLLRLVKKKLFNKETTIISLISCQSRCHTNWWVSAFIS